jgi:hypothetical protein
VCRTGHATMRSDPKRDRKTLADAKTARVRCSQRVGGAETDCMRGRDVRGVRTSHARCVVRVALLAQPRGKGVTKKCSQDQCGTRGCSMSAAAVCVGSSSVSVQR